MHNGKTKQMIQEAALSLFSQRGFSAVSVRDICKVVGIKESTIYYHFKNKQDIFETLLRDLINISNSMQVKFDNELSKIKRVEQRHFIAVGLSFLNNYLLEERILKFIRMLMIEQHVNDDATKLYHQILFDAPLKHNAAVFQHLMHMGCFKEGDIHYLAVEYYAPIYLAFQRYFACGNVTSEKRKEAGEFLVTHLQNFYDKYSVQ